MAMIKTCAQNTIVLSPDQTCTTPGSNARIFSRGLIEPSAPCQTLESDYQHYHHDHNMTMIMMNDNEPMTVMMMMMMVTMMLTMRSRTMLAKKMAMLMMIWMI